MSSKSNPGGALRGLRHDPELLYIGAMFHEGTHEYTRSEWWYREIGLDDANQVRCVTRDPAIGDR
jgi:hypothetical protein